MNDSEKMKLPPITVERYVNTFKTIKDKLKILSLTFDTLTNISSLDYDTKAFYIYPSIYTTKSIIEIVNEEIRVSTYNKSIHKSIVVSRKRYSDILKNIKEKLKEIEKVFSDLKINQGYPEFQSLMLLINDEIFLSELTPNKNRPPL